VCGIYGIVATPTIKPYYEAQLPARIGQKLYHRGPDDEGYYLDEQALLGMRRLSIIDLDSGQQPICNEDKTLWLVFNGEIYNYRELRVQLQQKGHIFKTLSDTEVIVHAYEEYGNDCVTHFNGMFAFAIWDSRRRRLFVARDRLGIKPLYYWANQHCLIFGSELKAILHFSAVPREVDVAALDQFLTLEYIPAPRTIFKGVHKLSAGHHLVFEQSRLTVKKYWDVPFVETPSDIETCRDKLKELIEDAVKIRMISDVPLGAFLSGGIDSSSIVACMSAASPDSIKTFSIGFEDATYNELPHARAVARHFGTDHYDQILNPDIASLASRLIEHLDEPFGDFSIFPTYLVSELARQQVKVVLSGDGGDEVFAGYETYVAQQYDRFYRVLPAKVRQQMLPGLLSRVKPRPEKKGVVNKAKRFSEGAALPEALQHTRWMMFLSDPDKTSLYQPELRASLNGDTAAALLEACFHQAPSTEPLAQQQYVDIKTYLAENILTKVDRMSMAASIEARVPLLDYRIVEFAVNLPAAFKLQRGRTKIILREAMQDRLPALVLNKPKQGFSIPLKHWLRGPLHPLMRDLLAEPCVRQRGYFKPQTVSRWMAEHEQGHYNHSHRLWALMVFELWQRTVLN
jgi:asparagine synthase (glutamine-hydrolysing)